MDEHDLGTLPQREHRPTSTSYAAGYRWPPGSASKQVFNIGQAIEQTTVVGKGQAKTISPIDADTTVATMADERILLGYQTHYLIDAMATPTSSSMRY